MTQIEGDFLLPLCSGFQSIQIQKQDQQLVLTVTSTNSVAFCPVCQSSSQRVHCNYTRTVTDLCCTDL